MLSKQPTEEVGTRPGDPTVLFERMAMTVWRVHQEQLRVSGRRRG